MTTAPEMGCGDVANNELNLQEELRIEHRHEMQRAIERVVADFGFKPQEWQYDRLMGLYDLGYDHGSTMEAEYGDHDV